MNANVDGSGGDDDEADEPARDEDAERLHIRQQTRYYARTHTSVSRLNFPVGIMIA